MYTLLIRSGRTLLADPAIETFHHFPDFRVLVKKYFIRAIHTTDMVLEDHYRLSYAWKNSFRIAIGSLAFLTTLLFVPAFLVGSSPFLLLPPVVFLALHGLLHARMFRRAWLEWGPLFALYVIPVNLFFCALIGAGSGISLLRHLVKR